jgi:hypothetical protein
MPATWEEKRPLGLDLLEVNAAGRYTIGAHDSLIRGDRIRCCVRDCPRWLAKRRRGVKDPGIYCPDHGISVSKSPTYVYRDYRRNFIVAIPQLQRVVPLKFERWRLGNERSEDAVSWNVFVGLAELGGLMAVFRHLSGLEPRSEPELYLWGVRIGVPAPHRWPTLAAVRDILEPGIGIPTEPDIMLRVPGQALVLVEAKFGSPNSTLPGRNMTVEQLVDHYPPPDGAVDPLDRGWISQHPQGPILGQLCRNVVFAQRLAAEGETPMVVNLVRQVDEVDIVERFAPHLAHHRPVDFRRATWEGLYRLPLMAGGDAAPLRRYFENKTSKLTQAFAF